MNKKTKILLLYISLVLVACSNGALINEPGLNQLAPEPDIPSVIPISTATQSSLIVELKPTIEDFPTATNLPEPVASPTSPPISSAPTIEEYLSYGHNLIFQDDINNAIQIFNQILSIDPNNARAYNGRGSAYEADGDFERALADYSLAIEIDPLYVASYNNRGEVLFLLEKADEALLDFSRAIEVDPTYGPAYQNRAIVQRHLGKAAAAIVDLQVYLALAPDAEDREIIEELLEELFFEVRFYATDVAGRLYAEDFSNPDEREWYGNGEGLGSANYSADGYRISIPEPNTGVWAYNTYWVTDMRLEVDVKFSSGSQDNLFGVMCRYRDNNNFYTLVISSDGYYGIGRRINGGALEPAGNGAGQLNYSTVIKTGDKINHISAECAGSMMRLWVNDVLLLELEDGAISSGMSGFFVYTYVGGGTSIMFDNFEIYEP